ncbi:MAG TPA: hydantoinase/oxoprolinase family protein [Methanocella sp.]|uniref:hydantoinase/oxoprolinase family protein n=1 Tax=Methanocella sp. TaxID=2052833 RepID=UPI002D023B25|nr:hydantoinase/oxoprolinase family protein [Methanocella sp.]HTY91360.1 hydantoinase/oxoprolinase family protein [Methanocella sp.]
MKLGIDIGGANTKAATSNGKFTYSKYLPLWKGCDIAGTLRDIKKKAGKTDAVGVTITGELADCFASKKEGIGHIAGEVKKVFPEAVFYGSDGKFYPSAGDHHLLSASNWSASARFIGCVHKDILFIDIGSTTTDIIPIVAGIPVAGLTDFQRLSRSELIYAGALRTNVAALLRAVFLRDMAVRTASELFAITADVNLLLGHIGQKDYSCDTPDGARKTKAASALRLARVVCCDLDELSREEALEIAKQAYWSQVEDLKEGIATVSENYCIRRAAICGLGSFIAKDALDELGFPYTYVGAGTDISHVFPAYAVAKLLEMEPIE